MSYRATKYRTTRRQRSSSYCTVMCPLQLKGSSRTLMALSIWPLSILINMGTRIFTTSSLGMACTSKFLAPSSRVKVKSWAELVGPGGNGGIEDGGSLKASAPRRCLFAGSKPSVGSEGAGLLRLDSSKASWRMRFMRSRYWCIRGFRGFSGLLVMIRLYAPR